jgi:hypothetical protein
MKTQRYRNRRFEWRVSMNGFKRLMTLTVLSMTVASPTLAQDVVQKPVVLASNSPLADLRLESPQHARRAAGSKVIVWLAPVGHRQPRAADVPASTSGSIDPDDAIVDQKISGICRGC